jgi:hypothetical protein
MDAFEEALGDVENLLQAAATDAADIPDLPTRNAVGMLIRTRELSVAVASPR